MDQEGQEIGQFGGGKWDDLNSIYRTFFSLQSSDTCDTQEDLLERCTVLLRRIGSTTPAPADPLRSTGGKITSTPHPQVSILHAPYHAYLPTYGHYVVAVREILIISVGRRRGDSSVLCCVGI